MAARNRITYAPLDLESARAALAADKPVRVGIVPTGYFPQGGVGRLRAVGDPAVDGEEFIQVEVTIGGGKDVIPFAPADLTPIKRGQAAPEPIAPVKPAPRSVTRSPTSKPTQPRPSGVRASSVESSNVESLDARRAAPRAPSVASAPAVVSVATIPSASAVASVKSVTSGMSVASTPPIASITTAAATKSAAAQPVSKPSPDPARPSGEGSDAPPIKQATKKVTPRGKRAPVTITISTTGVENTGWQLEARLGAKIVVKAAAISPARAAQLVATLENASLTDFVADVLAEHRTQAQARADRLALELAAAQAELAEYSAK